MYGLELFFSSRYTYPTLLPGRNIFFEMLKSRLDKLSYLLTLYGARVLFVCSFSALRLAHC